MIPPELVRKYPELKRLYTDGAPLAGVEIRLAGDGEILPGVRTSAWATPTPS
jgi:long-subunit acyl-CoA synthetase (AMP-forming)